MLKDHREDAPKIVNIGVWATAVVGVFVFALTVGIGLYNTVNTPISADTTAPSKSCKSGEVMLAFNNYPTSYFDMTKPENKGHVHKPFEDAMGGNWRCSMYCVPVPANANTASNDQATKEALTKYLTGATTNGKPVIIAKTESEFINMLSSNPTNLQNTVILTSTKPTCQGAKYGGTDTKGASIDYQNLVLSGQTVASSPVVKNNTVAELQAQIETEKQYTAAQLQDFTEAGATGKQNLTIQAPSKSGESQDASKDLAAQLICQSKSNSSAVTVKRSNPSQVVVFCKDGSQYTMRSQHEVTVDLSKNPCKIIKIEKYDVARDKLYCEDNTTRIVRHTSNTETAHSTQAKANTQGATARNYYNTAKALSRAPIIGVGWAATWKYRSDIQAVGRDLATKYVNYGRTVGNWWAKAGKWFYDNIL